jgi:hypothetical protein
MRLSKVVFALALAGAVAHCGSTPHDSTGVGNPGLTQEEQALVADQDDANDARDTASGLMSIPVLAINKAGEIADAETASGVATFSKNLFFPTGCATGEKTGAGQVTYTFAPKDGTACSGPLGLVAVAGKLIVQFRAKGAGSVAFDVTSEALTIGRTPITQSGSGDISFSGTTRTLVWSGGFNGTTPRGFVVDHSASYTVQQDLSAGCITIDGSGTTTLTERGVARGLTTSVNGYLKCGARNACPTKGILTFTGLGPRTFTMKLTFLGGRRASITTPRGTVVQIDNLVCAG